MAWIRDKQDLQYYNQPPNIPCYCQPILEPSDLYLQGVLDVNVSSFGLTIYLLDPDGNNATANIASYFDIYFATNLQGKQYFTARLKQFHPEMCLRKCWILQFIVGSNGFDYYTERYCSDDCCAEATGITTSTEDFEDGFVSGAGGLVIVPPVGDPTQDGLTPRTVTGDCGMEYLLLEAFSDCYNSITGKTYKSPTNTLSGTGYAYKDKILLSATIRDIPAQMVREYSLNCRLQRSQRFKMYQLQGTVLYPSAMMRDIQDYFSNQYIFLKGQRYELDTTEIFELVVVPNNCNPMFRLNVQLRECNTKQIFGCGDLCAENANAFVIGANVQGIGYYSETGMYLGSSCDDLITYFQSLQGVTNVTQLDPEDYDCDFECGVLVEGLPLAYLPTSIYVGSFVPPQRVFAVSPDTLPYICDVITPACGYAEIGEITVEPSECTSAEIGAITTAEIPAEDIYIAGTTEWVEDDADTNASRSESTVNFEIKVFNSAITYDAGDPDATIPFVSGQIGYIGASAWPTTDKIVVHPDFEALEASMIIQSNGYIMYSGYVTSADLTGSTIEFTNLMYTLP